MRIATWNLERGGSSRAARRAQEETLQTLGADVLVLTEPPASYRTGPGVVVSPALRSGGDGPQSWVAIVGAGVEPVPFNVPFERMAVAARVAIGGRSLCVYGAVLPWLAIRRQAPELVREGETFAAVFRRVLDAQRADIEKLRAEHEVVMWVGDFNQSVEGPNYGGSAKGRKALTSSLAGLGFVAFNGRADHRVPGKSAIDLICGAPSDLAVRGIGRIDPVRDGLEMSDHAGYFIALDP